MIRGAKSGDLVFCINNTLNPYVRVLTRQTILYLTQYKIYTVTRDQTINHESYQLHIINDNGDPEWFAARRFIPIENKEQGILLGLIYV